LNCNELLFFTLQGQCIEIKYATIEEEEQGDKKGEKKGEPRDPIHQGKRKK